jgi:hypothetical protein
MALSLDDTSWQSQLVNQSIGIPNQCAKRNNLRRIDILVLLNLLSKHRRTDNPQIR